MPFTGSHIIGLTDVLADLFHPTPPLDAATQEALGRVREIIGPLISTAPDFEHRLAEPVRHALQYCDDLILALPGPIEIDRRAFALDPLIHAFFATTQDIELMLGRSQTLRDYLDSREAKENEFFHAMFAARRHEKRTLGVAEEAGMLRRDVEQTLLYFSDHTLAAVSADPDITRKHLRQAAFDSLLKNFAAQIDSVRSQRQGLHTERDLALGRFAGQHDDEHQLAAYTRTVAELDERIRRMTETLQPKLLVEALAESLMAPDKALHLDPVEIRVDRTGVIAQSGQESGTQIDTLDFPELVGRDRRRHVVMLARIPRTEAEHAIEKIRDEQRRFIII